MAKHSFKTNTAELSEFLKKRKASLEEMRRFVEPVWKDIRLNYEPSLGKALAERQDVDANDANREDESIITSLPRTLVSRMASGLQSGITNQARPWFKFASTDSKTEEVSKNRSWLAYATERVQAAMNRSNLYQSFDQIYMHLGQFGTAAALMFPDDESDLFVSVIDEGAYWIAENRRKRVDVLMRRQEFTISQLIDEFGEGWIPDRYVDRSEIDGRKEERVTVWNLVCPSAHFGGLIKDLASQMTFTSVYWVTGHTDSNDGILAIRGFDYNPIIAPRWMQMDSVYGVGPGKIGLSDAKELQSLEKDKLKLVKQGVDPSLLAPDTMKNIPINSGPGGVTYYSMTSSMIGKAAPITRLFETQNQYEGVLSTIQSVEARLRAIFYADLFAMMVNLNMQPKQMTATEVNELATEKVALLGPILTRLNTDLLNPVVDGVWAIVVARDLREYRESGVGDNLATPPDDLSGQDLKVEYQSTLHAEQLSSARMNGIIRTVNGVLAVAQVDQSAIRMFDGKKAVVEIAKANFEGGVVRDLNKVLEAEEAEAKQQAAMIQQQQDAQQLQSVSRATKDLSQSKMGSGANALDLATQNNRGVA